MPRKQLLSYILFSVSLLVYGFMGYYVARHETVTLFLSYFLLFGIYLWILNKGDESSVKFWFYAAMAFRLCLLFATPALSDDFYRFIWDGRLLANGIHPFGALPGSYLNSHIAGIDEHLYNQLNSKEYFTIYPPFAQLIFWISVLASPASILGSVVVIRALILAAEIASLVLIQKLLQRFNVSPKNVLIYALNPLVILELTGNLHFEAFVICFVLLSLWLLWQSRLVYAGVSFGISICAKLLPMIFLPLFLLRLGVKKAAIFYAVIIATCLLMFAPLLNKEILDGFAQSFGLYFKRFEFNASVYYLFREYGFWSKGYNTIQDIGWKLALAGGIGILIISLWPFQIDRGRSSAGLKLKRFGFPASLEQVPAVMMWVMFVYFAMTTTLHPWYITTLLMLSVFTKMRFVIAWSAAIFLTYAGYTLQGFAENLYLAGLEYLVVFGYLVYELIWQKKYLYSSP